MSEQERVPARRLDPFAFVPETNLRFTLLIVMALSIGLNVARVLLPSQMTASISISALAAPDTGSFLGDEASYMRIFVRTLAFSAVNLLLTVGTLAVALWVYRGHPGRIRRRKKLRPVIKDDDPKFVAAVQSLADQAGVSPCPALVTADGSLQTDGQAFGLRKGYSLRLGGRLPLLLRKAPELFRATVLHELAHVYNGDVTRTYFTQALWVTVLLFVLGPFAASAVWAFVQDIGRVLAAAVRGAGPDWYGLFRFAIPLSILAAFQVAGLGLLFAGVRTSVLRVRETYADWRAVQWGAERGLRAILNRHATKKRSWWHRVWGLHPPPELRVTLLDDPKRLFTMTADLPLYAGAMLGAAISGIFVFGLFFSGAVSVGSGFAVELLSRWAASTVGSIVGFIPIILALLLFVGGLALTFGLLVVPAAGIMYVVAHTLGLQIRREVIANLAGEGGRGNLPFLRTGLTAAILVVGMQLGFVLTPVSGFAPLATVINTEGKLLATLLIPVMLFLWLICMTVVAWTWLIHTYIVSRRLLGAHTGDQPPRAKGRLLTIVQGLLLGILIIPALAAQSWIYQEFTGYILWQLLGGLAGSVGILVLYALLAIATWAAIEIWFNLSPRRCPNCGQVTHHRTVIHKSCEHCHADLAPWVFISL